MIPVREELRLMMPVVLRRAEARDLPLLEWFGRYAKYRRVFWRTFQQQERGERLMLVADCNGFPVGQVFVFFHNGERPEHGARAYMYSLRVMEMFRGHGIGTALIHAAERASENQGCVVMSLGVAKTNRRARALYERLGYKVYGEDSGEWAYVDQHGKRRKVTEPSWVLEKKLIMG
jgi:ribosomal protein S18 acetylase RimI-like enzyme